MASLLYQKGELSCLNAWLTGRGSAAAYGTPVTIPDGTAPGDFGLGMGTKSGGVGSTKTNALAEIIEMGTTTAGGYARKSLQRSTTGWPAATVVTGSYQTTAPQQIYTFTDTPVPNGATLWFVAGATTINEDNILFGADLSATRNFASGDVERITASVRLS